MPTLFKIAGDDVADVLSTYDALRLGRKADSTSSLAAYETLCSLFARFTPGDAHIINSACEEHSTAPPREISHYNTSCTAKRAAVSLPVTPITMRYRLHKSTRMPAADVDAYIGAAQEYNFSISKFLPMP